MATARDDTVVVIRFPVLAVVLLLAEFYTSAAQAGEFFSFTAGINACSTQRKAFYRNGAKDAK